MCISNNQNVTLLTRNKNTAHAHLGTHKLHKMTTHRLQVVSSSRDDWNTTHVEHQCLCEYLGRFKSAFCHENHGWKCYLKCEKRDAIWAEDRCNAYVRKYLPPGTIKRTKIMPRFIVCWSWWEVPCPGLTVISNKAFLRYPSGCPFLIMSLVVNHQSLNNYSFSYTGWPPSLFTLIFCILVIWFTWNIKKR